MSGMQCLEERKREKGREGERKEQRKRERGIEMMTKG